MTTTTHAAMHCDHRTWTAEINQWREDLRAWQQQVSAALVEIHQLHHTLEELGQSLRRHAAAARIAEETFCDHEHALAEFERGANGGADLVLLAQQHGAERDRQAKLRRDHEQLKARQHDLFTRWERLLKLVPERDSACLSP